MRLFIYFLSAVTFCFAISSCGSPKDSLDLNYKLEYLGEPMVMFQDYTYPSGKTFQVQRVSFYISDLKVSSSDGTEEVIAESEYIDLTNSHRDATFAAEGYNYKAEDLTLDYETVSFNIGLTDVQNSMVPEDFTSDNPLSLSVEYWRAWNSYVFVKIEGNLDINEDGEYGAGEAFALHLGTNESRRAFSTVMSESSADIKIDLEKVFNYGGNIYDIEANPRLHSLTPEILDAMDFLSTGVEGAISVE